MEKLKLHSPDLSKANTDKVAELFPQCVSEARDENGAIVRQIDFDLLRQELSGSIVEGPAERYQLTWPGKREALLTANAPIAKTLRPCREESVDFDTTRNLFIEGDNLDVLKLLQETYLGKVKMIYIDPPYNTGKDFIFYDNFSESSDEHLIRSMQKDENGFRLIANTDANGRFHSDWLSMIYSRLRLAKNLLSEDGAIFISINHKELSNLQKVCSEIFGEDNFLCLFAWRTDGNFDNQAKFKVCHEYILAYARQESAFPHPPVIDPNTPEGSKLFRPEIRNTIVKNGPKNPASGITLPTGFPTAFESGVIPARNSSWPHFSSDIVVEGGRTATESIAYSGWSSKELLTSFIDNKFNSVLDDKGQNTIFELTQSGAIESVKERGQQSHVISWLAGLGGSQKANSEIAEIDIAFDDYPKPLALIQYFIKMNKGDDFIVLDFFSGSATTAHAVMEVNAEDAGTRQFIMVQLPEQLSEASKAFAKGFRTISDIGKQRIRRAGEMIRRDLTGTQTDIGFRVLKVDSSNMHDVYYRPDEVRQETLLDTIDNIKPDRTPEDLLFHVLLDWGVPLDLPIFVETIEGKTVYFVHKDRPDLVACFERGVTEELVKAIAARAPQRAVFRDAGFASDSVKINVEQIFKLLSPATEVKVI